jgi:hypothetical protein
MKLGVVLTLSAIYMAAIGLITLFAPHVLTFGAVDASASAEILFSLRIPASMALGIAVLNWMSRNAEASVARKAVVTANVTGFALATVLGIWGGLSGAPAAAWAFVVVDALFMTGFLVTGRDGKGAVH